jgi:hypothetical protein
MEKQKRTEQSMSFSCMAKSKHGLQEQMLANVPETFN